MPETGAAATTWRGIDELAEVVGGYCWAEKRVFEVAGGWATGAGDPGLEPAVRVWCAGVSRRHGLLAARWAERLPVRAGVDRAALVVPPTGRWRRPSTWWPPLPTPATVWRCWSRRCSPGS